MTTTADEDAAITEVLARGRQAWPELAPAPPVEEVLRRKANGRPLAEIGRELDPAEVFIAAALAARDPAAPAAFESRYFGAIDATLSAAGAVPVEVDEIRQVVRTRLLVGDRDGFPPIVDYAGDGRLAGLIRVTATRAYLNLRTRARPTTDGDADLAAKLTDELDPRRAMLADRERTDVTEAIRRAAQALERRLRTLLRLHLVHRMSIDRLADVFEIHRATAARQLARAREELIANVRQELTNRWGSSDDSLSLVSSRLELSLERLFATAADDVGG